MTPKELFDSKIAAKIKTQPDVTKKVNAVYRFDLSGPNGGTWIVDMKDGPTAGVRQADEAGQCTISMTDNDFCDMVGGKLNPQMAFMSGKIKIKGDMGLAMKLGQILQG
jgi:putative sterol carrier protein